MLRVTACLTLLLATAAFEASSNAFASDVQNSTETRAPKPFQRGPVRAILGLNGSLAQDARQAQTPESVPLGTVRLRDESNKGSDAQIAPVSITRTVDEDPQENAPVLDAELSGEELLPEPPAEQQEEPAAEQQEEPVTEEQPEQPVQPEVPQTDEDTRALEARQKSGGSAGLEIPAEVKARALSSDDEDAPDARVRLTDLDVSEEDIAEHSVDVNEETDKSLRLSRRLSPLPERGNRWAIPARSLPFAI